MSTHYILISRYNLPWPRSGEGRTVYVKEGNFFASQGGLEENWGKDWIPVEANSIDHAREIGMKMEFNK